MYFPRIDVPPIDCLPDLLKYSILEVEENIQAPLPLILASALGACSLSFQHNFRVQRPTGQISPISLFILTIAESGERKSTVDNLFSAPIFNFQLTASKEISEKIDKYEIEFQSYEAEEKGLKRAISRKAANLEDTSDLKARLIEIASQKPQKPQPIKLIYENVATGTLKLKLYENSKSAALISAEGGTIFKGRALNDLASLNKLWDGGSITVDRATSESFTLEHAALTISLMTQEGVLNKFLENTDGEARKIGFFARCLISAPNSTQGTRFIDNTNNQWNYLNQFQELLSRSLDSGSHFSPESQSTILKFSPEAVALWVDAFNQIEKKLGPNGDFSEINDYASKLGENIARIAAILHCIDGTSEEVSANSTLAAIEIMNYYTWEFIRIFSEKQKNTIIHNAEILTKWLTEKQMETNQCKTKKNYILQFGPKPLRTRDTLNATIEYLAEQGEIIVFKECGTTYIKVNNVLLNSLSAIQDQVIRDSIRRQRRYNRF